MTGKYKDSILGLDFDHEGQETVKYFQKLDKRMQAFKRMILWAMATDLLELVTNKIPSGRKYDRMRKALKLGEVTGDAPVFAVYLDTNAKQIKEVDIPKTIIFIKPRKLRDRIDPGVKVLFEKGPWTVDTIPFWPSEDEAIVIQRKVEPRIVDKITKMQKAQRGKITKLLIETGRNTQVPKETKPTQKRSQNAKAVPDIVFEMLSLEFGGKNDKGSAPWRTSLATLSPGMVKTILTRYKKIEQTLTDARYNGWSNYPAKVGRITPATVKSLMEFQKKLGL